MNIAKAILRGIAREHRVAIVVIGIVSQTCASTTRARKQMSESQRRHDAIIAEMDERMTVRAAHFAQLQKERQARWDATQASFETIQRKHQEVVSTRAT